MSDTGKEQVRQGGCLCGRVRYRVDGKLRDVVNCHCTQCRRTHGHFSAYTAAVPDALTLLREDSLKWFRSSENAARGFCSECGASLFWKPASGEYVAIAAGTLDPPTGLRTVAHIFCAHAGDYYDIDDGLPAHAEDHEPVPPADPGGNRP